jgi:DNA processing protein
MHPLAYLSFFPKFNNRRFKMLADYFCDSEEIWKVEMNDLRKLGWDENIADEFLVWREKNSPAKFQAILEKEKIWTLSLGETDYPALLREIPDAPVTLFIRGEWPKPELSYLGVVGTRKVTNYGKLMAEKIVSELARTNIVIVSGLALGLDAIAHDITINQKGTTIAVLGGGVDKNTIGPGANRNLAEKIIFNGGCLVSEYPPYFEPNKATFPARNRIIAGLSAGTLVIEAPLTSGALITAKLALDYNREVMAVPHPANSFLGEGCNQLIKQGANLVTEARDVAQLLNLADICAQTNILPQNLNETEKLIISCLTHSPIHIDKIIEETELESQEVSGCLVMMEINGLVKNMGNLQYIKS